jgi:hypothetical protein
MARGLDHVVHAVHDLDAAAELYRRLGFTVGARNRHPWGTDNRIVQLHGAFVELLTVAEPEKLAPPALGVFSFGAFNRDFLERGEGLSMLVLESRDAQADAAAFRQAGIGDFEVFRFEREGSRPDGAAVKVAFSLAFASDSGAPNAGFFVCQQHYPENFWNPAFQAHPNTASSMAAVVLVAENPTDHHIFLSAFTGERDLQATSSGITVATPRGEVQVMEPRAFALHFGTSPPETADGARIAAIRFAVRDMSAAERLVRQSSAAAERRMGRLVVGPQAAFGATLVFEQA